METIYRYQKCLHCKNKIGLAKEISPTAICFSCRHMIEDLGSNKIRKCTSCKYEAPKNEDISEWKPQLLWALEKEMAWGKKCSNCLCKEEK